MIYFLKSTFCAKKLINYAVSAGKTVSNGSFEMIKNTFFNLPERKQQRVIDAVITEFAAEDSDRVSINSIIERADISRGSFYQYFDDKMDLVEVLINYYITKFEEKISDVINISRGDIFYSYEECFSVIADLGSSERDRIIFKKLFGTQYSSGNIITEYMQKRCCGFEKLNEIRSRLSRNNLKSRTDDYFYLVNEVLTLALKKCVRDYFVEDDEYSLVKKRYLKQIDIIKSGACA